MPPTLLFVHQLVLLLSPFTLAAVVGDSAVASAQLPPALQKFRYNQLELAAFPAVSEPLDPASSSSGQQLTLLQVRECQQRMQSGCQSAGYDDLLRLDKRSGEFSSTKNAHLELETRLQQLLRESLFQAHRSDRPDERLAICLLVQTPNIFDQWRPRSDPICLTLQGANFRLETSIPEALRILCTPAEADYSRVFVVCSRPAAANEMVVDSDILNSPEPVIVGHQQRTTLRGLAVSTTDVGAVSRIVCALVWALTIALSIVAMLVAGTLLSAALRRRRGSMGGIGVGISENAVAPSGDDISSKGSLIVVTATPAEVAGMSASIGLRERDYCVNYADCPVDSADFTEDEIGTLESDPYSLHLSTESRL